MTDAPNIDLGAEASLAGYEVGLIALAVLVALAFLFRGVLRRRRAATPACTTCPGCSTGAPCQAVHYDFSDPEADKGA